MFNDQIKTDWDFNIKFFYCCIFASKSNKQGGQETFFLASKSSLP